MEATELCIRESNEVAAALDRWRLRTIGVEVSGRFRTMQMVAERRRSANGVRCVVVDDNDQFIDLVSDLLVRDGFDVVGAAGDHVQVLRLVADVGPDVALIDLFLGQDSGIELILDIVCAGLAEQIYVNLVSTCAEDDLAETFELPPAYLNKRLQALVRAGILTSSPGVRGGFQLARPPEKITLMEIVAAIEGREGAFRCTEIRRRGAGADRPPQEFERQCVITTAIRKAEMAWRRELASQTLADMMAAAPSPAAERTRRWYEGMSS